MGWNKWQEIETKLFDSGFVIQAFHMITVAILTLLLPLSFLLLSSLSNANYQLSLASDSQTNLYSVYTLLIFDITPTVFYTLVFLVSILSFVNALTSRSQKPIVHLPLYVSWFLLCMFQACLRLAMEGGVAFKINESGVISPDVSLTSTVLFFLGLHETMMYWSRMVVKPVVDDTILGFRKEKMLAESVVVAAGLGWLWWWRLRDEVEILVIMVELKKELMIGVGVCDFIAWSLYYLTMVIGVVKFAKVVIWLVILFIFERVKENHCGLSCGNDEKV